jgi:hypothetical protein
MFEEARVSIDLPEESPAEGREWLGQTSASVMQRALALLEVPLPKKWKLRPYFNLSEHSDQLRQMEMRHFQDLDGVMLMRSYFLSAHGTLPSLLVALVLCDSSALLLLLPFPLPLFLSVAVSLCLSLLLLRRDASLATNEQSL